ncbi:MAG TPA: AAA family ATPase [Prevotella sp.]|nr:AAA family ATPase [Prevotella sp.]
MSKYRFKIQNYHAIKEADIAIDGITVIAGPNGSGKSTLSRWLYYVIDTITDFDGYLLTDFRENIKELLITLYRIRMEVSFGRRTSSDVLPLPQIDMDAISSVNNIDQIPLIVERLHVLVSDYSKVVLDYLQSDRISDAKKNRILRFLSKDDSQSDIYSTIEGFSVSLNQKLDLLQKHVVARSYLRNREDAVSFIHDILNEEDNVPANVELSEDNVNVWDKRLGTLLGIDQVIYIDTPMPFELSDIKNNIFLKRLNDRMTVPSKALVPAQKKLLQRISLILSGQIALRKNLFEDDKLYYERKDGKLSLPLDKLATGMKTFAYLFQLLKNGCLNDKTVLMVDEPEVHLHPQWVVQYAHIVVLLHKMLGVKIVLASHNPDFVAAIHAISKKEKVADKTNFYLSKKIDGSSYEYEFEPLGNNIDPIFESFNLALTRIQQYGDTDF